MRNLRSRHRFVGIIAAVKHLIELLLCSGITAYCLVRMIAVAPAAFEELGRVVSLGLDRQRRIEEVLDAD